MKKHAPIIAILAVSIGLGLSLPACGQSLDLWVSPLGSDQNIGTSKAPLASISAALEKVRHEQTARTNSDARPFRILLNDGTYPLAEPLIFKTANSDSGITIEAAAGGRPVLSGGLQVKGWQKLTTEIPGLVPIAKGKIWIADAPRVGGRVLNFRQLWVNDTKTIRSRSPNGNYLLRLSAWNKASQTAVIPATTITNLTDAVGLEMVIDQVWEIAVLRVKSIQREGTNALVTFRQPESDLEFTHPWPPVIVTTNYQAPFFFANAIQFLDSPGEWFEDVSARKIYYWPRNGEDMLSAKVFAPVLETLVRIEGASNAPISNVCFKGITFAHTTWLRPTEQGHVPLQAGMFLLDARKLSPHGTPYHSGLDNLAWIGRPPTAVQVKHAQNIAFENCNFEHLAATGLDFSRHTRDDLIQGCTFRDIGGNGLQIGHFSDPDVETHIPWNPADAREICTRETIANNLITDCGNEDWGCVGIAAGYARNLSIHHNEIFHLPYSGISVGWGWTKMTNALRDNLVFANRIHHIGQHLGDLGGIYTLSAQPGTVVAENSISDIEPSPYVPDPEHWFYLYLDEGSSGITVRDNGGPSEKFLKNANGPGNVWTNNGPQVSEKIKSVAGLEPAFLYLLK